MPRLKVFSRFVSFTHTAVADAAGRIAAASAGMAAAVASATTAIQGRAFGPEARTRPIVRASARSRYR
jgi:hypothetical protein